MLGELDICSAPELLRVAHDGMPTWTRAAICLQSLTFIDAAGLGALITHPGQPWMWLYTFWYQVKPFSTSGNADALVWGLMAILAPAFILVPYIPGLRSLPRHLGVHRLIWSR